MYAKIDENGVILETVTIQDIRQRHRKTLSVTDQPDLIETPDESSIQARKAWKRELQEVQDDEEYQNISAQEPKPNLITYIKAVDEPPDLDDTFEITNTGVKRVDGVYRVTYSHKKLPAKDIEARKLEKRKQELLVKINSAINQMQLRADIVRLLVQVAEAQNIKIPESLKAFTDEFGSTG